MRESARIYDVRMAQFVLKIEKLSHIIGVRGSQDLRSPSPIMVPVPDIYYLDTGVSLENTRSARKIHTYPLPGLNINSKSSVSSLGKILNFVLLLMHI